MSEWGSTAGGEQNVMSDEWHPRPVLFVADIDRSVDFYVKQLGFTQPWRYEKDGKARVAQITDSTSDVLSC
jgi:hypothetical protein